MIDKQGESNISTNVTKKAAVLSHMGSRTAACLLILHSFLASVFKSHQSIRALCCISEMSPLAWKNRFSEKSVFPNFSARKKPVKMQKHRTFVRCFLCCIFHQHILGRDGRLELPTSCSQSKRATNCANPGYEIQTDPTAGCSNSGVCLQMATPQNLTAVHVACRKRTECRRKTILYFTEICRKVKSYIEEAPCPYGHGALILATAAAIAAAAVVAAAPTAAAAAAPDDDQQNDDPAAVPAASATVITAHIGTSYEIEM